jgi:hypothetical protein
MLDYHFHYKNVGRFILFLKQSTHFFHVTNILEFSKLILFFDVNNISDLSNTSILSHIFFFKYYFGVIPFYTNYFYKFKLNVHYYSFFIQYNFFKKNIYYPLYFFFNDIYYMINKSNIIIIKEFNFWSFSIKDMNFFIEKKNTLGFFNLKHKLTFKICWIKIEQLNIDNLFYLFKYNI